MLQLELLVCEHKKTSHLLVQNLQAMTLTHPQLDKFIVHTKVNLCMAFFCDTEKLAYADDTIIFLLLPSSLSLLFSTLQFPLLYHQLQSKLMKLVTLSHGNLQLSIMK